MGCTLMVAVPLGLGWGADSAACRSLRPVNMVRLLCCVDGFSGTGLMTSVPSCTHSHIFSRSCMSRTLCHGTR